MTHTEIIRKAFVEAMAMAIVACRDQGLNDNEQRAVSLGEMTKCIASFAQAEIGASEENTRLLHRELLNTIRRWLIDLKGKDAT
jgi:hypothetical protein